MEELSLSKVMFEIFPFRQKVQASLIARASAMKTEETQTLFTKTLVQCAKRVPQNTTILRIIALTAATQLNLRELICRRCTTPTSTRVHVPVWR